MKLIVGRMYFESVRTHNAELVRNWRNREHVRSVMIYQKYITAKEHKQWIKKISNVNNIYLIVTFEKPFGVVNLKDIDWDKMEAETGIFVGEPNFLKTIISSACALVTLHFAFNILNFNTITSKSLKSNNFLNTHPQKLGFQIYKFEDDINYWKINKYNFTKACQNYIKYAFDFIEFNNIYTLKMDQLDIKIGFHKIFEKIMYDRNVFFIKKSKEDELIYDIPFNL